MQLLESCNCGVRAEKRRCFLIAVTAPGSHAPLEPQRPFSRPAGGGGPRAGLWLGWGWGWGRVGAAPLGCPPAPAASRPRSRPMRFISEVCSVRLTALPFSPFPELISSQRELVLHSPDRRYALLLFPFKGRGGGNHRLMKAPSRSVPVAEPCPQRAAQHPPSPVRPRSEPSRAGPGRASAGPSLAARSSPLCTLTLTCTNYQE